MKQCPFCKAELEDEARFCLYCMTSLEEKQIIDPPKAVRRRWPWFTGTALLLCLAAVGIWFSAAGSEPPVDIGGSTADRSTTTTSTVAETASSGTESDARTDVYAAGVLLNVMITGKHPSEQIAQGRAGRIVRKCTHINPDDRYQTAEKLAEAL